MNFKIYFKLLLPFLLIGILLAIFLPVEYKYLSIIIPLFFWIIYFIWSKNKENKFKG